MADRFTDYIQQGNRHSELITEMLRTHSLVPFKTVLGMSDDEYERIVQGAIDELAENGEIARIYIHVSVLLGIRKYRSLIMVQACCIRTKTTRAMCWTCKLFGQTWCILMLSARHDGDFRPTTASTPQY